MPTAVGRKLLIEKLSLYIELTEDIAPNGEFKSVEIFVQKMDMDTHRTRFNNYFVRK
jgi:hypothetical protein